MGNSSKKEISSQHIFSITFVELVNATHLNDQILMEMIEQGLFEPLGNSPDNWEFDEICFKRAQRAAKLYYDLEIDLQGIALALDLLEKIEKLENELSVLKTLK